MTGTLERALRILESLALHPEGLPLTYDTLYLYARKP